MCEICDALSVKAQVDREVARETFAYASSGRDWNEEYVVCVFRNYLHISVLPCCTRSLTHDYK
jgi:hypothetical protein